LGAGVTGDLAEGVGGVARGSVAARDGHRVPGVGESEQPGARAGLGADELVGVAAAVIAFVMVADPVVCV
jgi:hypothetical protein